jgi:pyruvate dehydrogenase E2 component (dihydrolipoamide acetyltransferase)
VPIEVKMAKLSPTMESGQLVKWLVKVGDKVKEGDTLAEVQTDKAVMPMESFDDGVVAVLDVKEGDEIALGQRVLVLAKKGEDPKAVASSVGQGKAAPAKAAAAATSAAPPQAAPAHADSTLVAGNGHDSSAVAAVTASPAGGRVRSSPLARKIAGSEGIDLAQVAGSGPNGRVIRRDVEAYLAQAKAAPKAAPAASAAIAGAARQSKRIPHSRMRKTIADRMQKAKQAAPEIHVTVDIRMDKVVEIRETLNKRLAAEKIKLSLGDFVTKAVAMALVKHPGVNASYEPDAIVEHGSVNVGIAVALEGGLIVPVLQNADRLGLREIRIGTEALAVAARSNKLTPAQMTGGTFTISNLGMYGVRQFDAILNLPEVGILAVGSVEKRPVVEGDKLVVGTIMTVTITADHRAVDGALAAEFLRSVKEFLEEPAAMLL